MRKMTILISEKQSSGQVRSRGTFHNDNSVNSSIRHKNLNRYAPDNKLHVT